MGHMIDVVNNQLRTGQFLIETFTKDLSDAEYFQPALEGGNHAAWIMGHLATAEDQILSTITGSPKRIPEPTHELFKGGSTCYADPSKYPSRKELDGLFADMRKTTLESLSSFDESKAGDAAPDSPLAELFPTIGSLWGMIASHPFWHIGQLTDCRRKLKKPGVLGG